MAKELWNFVYNWLLEDPSRRQEDVSRVIHERFGIVVTQQTVSHNMAKYTFPSC